MAVGRGAGEDRPVQMQMLADAARREVHDLHQGLLELAFVDLPGAVQVGVNRQRTRNADRIGKLKGAAVGEVGGDDVLCEVSRRIGRRPVDLGRILARESAAAVRRGPAVGVDDDLAAREPAVAVGAADEELAGGVDVPNRFRRDPALRKRGDHIRTNKRRNLFGGQLLDEMLVRDDDLGRLDRLAVLVAHRDLALGVGAERSFRARMTGLRYLAQDFVRVVERRRHQFGRFAAGVAEHDALIAGALVLVAGGVHALRDVGGLRMQQDLDLRVAPVEPLLLVADVLDRLARRRLDLLVRKVRVRGLPQR